jgi:hypothetical protein
LSAVGFYRDQEGAVHLEGEVEIGEIPLAVLQLPVGYRPEGDVTFYGVGPRSASRVRITSGGFVEIYAGGKAEPVSFDGIVYRADLRTEA